uniref:Toxin n=1 Tax=Globodera pallida TaxID=36090 RepID=A0A183BT91_GLOPA
MRYKLWFATDPEEEQFKEIQDKIGKIENSIARLQEGQLKCGVKLRGGRRKKDVLGNAGGDVGGWDHPIDSSYDYVDTMFKKKRIGSPIRLENMAGRYGVPAGRR